MKSQETKHYKMQTSFQSIIQVEKILSTKKYKGFYKKRLSFQAFRKYAIKSNIQEEYKISEIFPKNLEFQTPTKIYIYTASFMSQEPKKLIQNSSQKNINIFLTKKPIWKKLIIHVIIKIQQKIQNFCKLLQIKH